jgi:hypothetical protein
MSAHEIKPTPRAVAHAARAQTRRARQKREGVVIMIVMLMIVMATGTAMFAIQSTQYEQRAATAIGEANWARSISECTAMAALAFVEDSKSGGGPPNLELGWKPEGSNRAKFSRKFAFPEPLKQNPGQAGDEARSQSLEVAPYASNAPLGLGIGGFLPTERKRTSALFPLFNDRDDQTAATAGLRYIRAHWLQESFPIFPEGYVSGGKSTQRTRTVVTGFGEIHVVEDPLDSDGIRELHELDAISRGYIDKVE